MAGSSAQAQAEAPGRLARLRTRWPRKRVAHVIRVGCLPLLVLGALALIGFVALVTYRVPRPWITDVREWRVGGRLSVLLYGLAGLQYFANWLLGLLAAAAGGRVTAHGVDLRTRLRIARRGMVPLTVVVTFVRLILIITLVVYGLYAFTHVFRSPLDVPGALNIERVFLLRPVAAIVMGGLLVVHLLAGPWLRVRYSLWLGVWAASYARTQAQRVWNALSARLGAGLAGALTLVWGGSLASLVLSMIFAPAYSPRPGNGLLEFYPHLPSSLAQTLASLNVISAIVAAILIGQIVLPVVVMRRAQRRLGVSRAEPSPQA